MLRRILAALVTVGALVLTCGTSAAAQAASDTARYVVTMAGRPAGSERAWLESDGTRAFAFEYNDRGRGPTIVQRIRLDADGTPVRVSIDGRDYLRNTVNERFTRDGRRASWQSASEHGERDDATGFYVSFDAAPSEIALLARALLARPDHTLPLLPAGEARIDSVAARTLSQNGRSARVVAWGITGLGLEPEIVWLDEKWDLFAVGGGWSMVIREGWEGVIPALLEAQDAATLARGERLAKTLADRPSTAVAFADARLVDVDAGRVREHTTVVVQGDRIVAVGPTGGVVVPPGARVIDASGKTLVPGLWDMHVHEGDIDGMLQIASGITTVRDLANDVDELLERRRRFDGGTLIGPRILMAGFIDGPGPFAGPSKVLVSTDSAARAWVNRYADLGYVQIKVYSSLDPKLMPVIIAEAHRRGLRVSGHIPFGLTAEKAVRLGVDEIQHANFLVLNFLDDTIDTRTPRRFTAPAQQGAELQLGSARVQSFLRLLADRGIVVDPTLNVFEEMFTARKGTISPTFAPAADRFPPVMRRGFLAGGLPVPDSLDERYRSSFATMLRLVKELHRLHVPIVAGTDALAGFALDRELELYAEAGIPNMDVLRLATIGAARIMKRDRDVGSIAKGKLADLVLIDGDPTRRMSDLRRTELVMKGGVLYRAADLWKALGVAPVPPSRAASMY